MQTLNSEHRTSNNKVTATDGLSSLRRWMFNVGYSMLVFICFSSLSACSPKPRPVDDSQRINAGINILAPSVLAAQKLAPSTRPTGVDENDLIQVISDSDQPHYKLVELLRSARMVSTLQQEGPYTIFAPTDEAFDKLPPGVFDSLQLPSHHAELVNFLKFHLLSGRIDADALAQTDGQVPTLAGPSIVIKGIGGKAMVQDANVLQSESTATNGAVHWIDNILIPPA